MSPPFQRQQGAVHHHGTTVVQSFLQDLRQEHLRRRGGRDDDQNAAADDDGDGGRNNKNNNKKAKQRAPVDGGGDRSNNNSRRKEKTGTPRCKNNKANKKRQRTHAEEEPAAATVVEPSSSSSSSHRQPHGSEVPPPVVPPVALAVVHDRESAEQQELQQKPISDGAATVMQKKRKLIKKKKKDVTAAATNNSTIRAAADDDEDDPQQQRQQQQQHPHHHDTNTSSSHHHRKGRPPDPPRDRDRDRPRYIVAPMVGASERPFRLLCRKYGADQAYTPMLSSERFVLDDSYAREECGCDSDDDPTAAAADRPATVAHLAANDPQTFARAAVKAQTLGMAGCDLNLGCPQRTAYLGHFGSYLMDDPDLIVRMVKRAVEATAAANSDSDNHRPFPISAKIRLLDTCDATLAFCRRLCAAGVARIAVHGRYRASWERTAAGARDGPAHLDQIAQIGAALALEFPRVQIVTNGNTVTWDDVPANLAQTGAAGLMSAEGILDDPALFLPRHGSDPEKPIRVWTLEPTPQQQAKIEALQAKLLRTAQKQQKSNNSNNNNHQSDVGSSKDVSSTNAKRQAKAARRRRKLQRLRAATLRHTDVALGTLQETARDPLRLCHEYLDWVEACRPLVPQRTVVFHARRMCRAALARYQLLPDCLQAGSVDDVRLVLRRMQHYVRHPDQFVYDRSKAAAEREAVARRRREEGKRKAYEARMVRKAKREGLTDLHHYLKQGAVLPSAAEWQHYQSLPRDQLLAVWKQHHGQHCLAHHLQQDGGGCPRGRACAFLHADAVLSSSQKTENAFVERDEVAG